MNKKIAFILAFMFFILVVSFIFIKFHFLKAKDFKPDTSKKKSIVDLRPDIIAKLQQLVKDGSNGLYILSIEKINPDVLASKLDVVNASISIDSTVMRQLDHLKKLPDDIFKIHFNSLHIDGIGITDLLEKKRLDITSINISHPVIEVYHHLRVYNKPVRERNDTLSLYHRLKGQMNQIGIGKINIESGTFINYADADKRNVTRINNITVHINELLIDSSTQFDANRFLFAKHAMIDARNYMVPIPDSLYYFKTGAITILAEQHKIILLNVDFCPRGNRKQFESKLQFRKDMYHIVLPKVILYDVDWWAMMNHEKFIAKKGDISGGSFKIFFDKSLPANPVIKADNFPQQLLMKIPLSVSITNLNLKNVNVSYEEYNPKAKQSGVVIFDVLNARVNNVSNIGADIKKHPVADFSANGLFMHHIPMRARFTFNLSKYKTGDFTADITMDTLDKPVITSFAEPLGLFSVKTGELQHGIAHIEGNNSDAKGKVAISYSNLYINPLKKAGNDGVLKKKHLTGLIANVFLIKNENPAKGNQLRQPVYSVKRDHHSNFFNLIWITILTGILKTIGIPVKFVIH